VIEHYLIEGLKKVNQEATLRELGDRSQYIGSSDVTGCMRKAVMEKLDPTEPDLTTLLRYERGHMVEGILKKALDSMGVEHEYQHEASHPEAPLKAHIDFCSTAKTPKPYWNANRYRAFPARPMKTGLSSFITRWVCWPWRCRIKP